MTTTASTRKFGVEIEAYNVSMHQVADALQAVGIDARVAGYTHSTTPYWKLVSDASLTGAHAFELVSPILEGEAGFAELAKACEVMTSMGVKVNRSCGLHVHVDGRDLTLPQLKNVCRMFAKYEPCMDEVVPPSRRANDYCRSNLARLGGLDAAYTKIAAATNSNELAEVMNGPQHSHLARYHKLNLQSMLRHGTVEFRQHSGTVDAVKAVTWARMAVAFVVDATRWQSVRKDKVAHNFENFLKVTQDARVRKSLRARRAALAAPTNQE